MPQAQAQAAEMDTGSQIAMWLGLGIGAIGLINALTNLIAMFCLGTATCADGDHGVIGQDCGFVTTVLLPFWRVVLLFTVAA